MTREERTKLINHLKYNRSIGADYLITDQDVDEIIKVLEQEPKTGHWNCGDDMFEYAICSLCKHETGEAWEYAKRNFKYCPNCGAKMIEPQESEE